MDDIFEDTFEGAGGFSLPDDAGVTPLPVDRDNGLCSECEARPAFFEVRRPGDETARRLCHECLFREFAPPAARWSDMLEREAERLADAERTEPPEALGLMAEFLEEWWAGQTRPAPPFVTEFIARHRASAPPPAAPVLEGEVAPEDVQAARVALLVMRGALAQKHPIDERQYVIEPSPAPVSRDEAAELLARMPKPLDCHARVEGGVMTLRCRTITEASHLSARAQSAEYWAEHGGHFAGLRRERGDRVHEAKIFCLGWRESLVVTVSDVDRYERDYEVRPMGTNASPPSAYLATNPEAARAAHAEGTAYLMQCHIGADDRAAEDDGRVIEVGDAETGDYPEVYALSAQVDVTCERCGERPATWLATDTRTQSWRERRLCEVCTAAALAPHALADAQQLEGWVAGLSEKGRRSAAGELVSALGRMERWWKRLPMPPEVAAALERCRQLGGNTPR